MQKHVSSTGRRLRPARNGTSLVEVVTAMGVASVMLLVAFRVLHTVLKTERTTTRAIWSSHSANRLSRVFRSDIRAAGSVEILPAEADQPESLTLTIPDGGTVRYEVERQGIARVAIKGDESPQQELFRFPKSTTCRFERLVSPDRLRLLLSIPRNPTELPLSPNSERSTAPSDRVIPIEALIARDHRFDSPQPTTTP